MSSKRTAFLSPPSVVCALGESSGEPLPGLFGLEPTGVEACADLLPRRSVWFGRIPIELSVDSRWPLWAQTRNNAALERALGHLRARVESVVSSVGAHRVGVCIGTSTSGISEAEKAVALHQSGLGLPSDYAYGQQELNGPARFVAWRLGLGGPTSVISTACSSSAKALAAAARWLALGVVDAVIAGGCDTFSGFTHLGFDALGAVSARRCNPLSVNRDGINLGEAAALFVMTRDDGAVRLAGWGETSDAHHLSAPEPSGRGAAEAMRQALARARVAAADIDYINLHGTATPLNDLAESLAVADVVGLEVPVSSTKPLTGHTLGAAGALEAAISWWVLTGGVAPPHWFDGEKDPALPPLRLVLPGERLPQAPRSVLSTSLAFGGSNIALVLRSDT
jgi:3-oxoacyl-[acyl-carrier-protein] synthase I